MIRDGRSGVACPNCGAYLQPVTMNGEPFDRCPWAKEGSWEVDGHHVVKRIYCAVRADRPSPPGGIPTVMRRVER